MVEQNQTFCRAANIPHETVPQRHDQVRKLWETAAARDLTLPEALDTLRQSIKAAPFRYSNVPTFAAIAGKLVASVCNQLPPVEASILKTTVCRYVEGKVGKAELRQVANHFARQFKAGSAQASAVPAPPRVQPQPQTT